MNSRVQHLQTMLPHIALPAIPPRVRHGLGRLRRRASRHRRAIAITGSVLLHLLFILLLLPSAPKGLSSGGSGGTASGAGTGETYAAVDLYRAVPAATAVKTPGDAASDALDTPADTVKPQTDAIQTTTPADIPQLSPTDTPLPSAAATGGAGQAGTTSGATGDDLWAAIAPCWKRVAGTDTLAVALKITFAGNGGLSKPPVIERADGASITPQSLHSEAQAITALAQCGAYPMAAGKQDVEVHFPRPE